MNPKIIRSRLSEEDLEDIWNFIARDSVFHIGIDIGIIVDFDDIGLTVFLFEIHSVETVTDLV